MNPTMARLRGVIMMFLMLFSCGSSAFAQAELYDLYARQEQYTPKDICNLYRQYDKYVLLNEYKFRLTKVDFGLAGPVRSVKNHEWTPEQTQVDFNKDGLVSGIRKYWGWDEETVMKHDVYLWDDRGCLKKITMTFFEYDETMGMIVGAVPEYDSEGRIARMEFAVEHGSEEDRQNQGKIIEYTYDERGLLTGYVWTQEKGRIPVAFTRDGDGRLVREERTVEGEAYATEYRIEYGYDEKGRLTSMTYMDRETGKPDSGWEYSYEYDSNGLISELREERFEYNEEEKKRQYDDFTRYHYDKHMNVVRYDCAATSDNRIVIEYYECGMPEMEAISADAAISRATGNAGNLEAAPWKHVVGLNEQSLPDKEDGGMFFELTPDNLAALPKLAEEGNALAASMMAGYARNEQSDMNQSVRWLRKAVENGDADSAFTLGKLYFPSDGPIRRADFDFRPDAVLGYAWHAIGLAGLVAIEEKGAQAHTTTRQARELVESLRMLLLPSERDRAADILSRWPESLPPDTPLEPLRGNVKEDTDERETDSDEPPDADAIVELVRQRALGKGRVDFHAEGLSAPPEFDPVVREAFAKIQALADSGDEDAKYMVAWCRLFGFGAEADEAGGLSVITAKADSGDVGAMFFVAAWSFRHGDEARAVEFATRAAEKGDGKSMRLMSEISRSRRDQEGAIRWIEKAAEAGEQAAVEEMLSIAESSQDWRKIVFWLTATMLRTPDPMVAYRCRMLIAYVGREAGEEALQKAMEAGERWHHDHPVSFLNAE